MGRSLFPAQAADRVIGLENAEMLLGFIPLRVPMNAKILSNRGSDFIGKQS